MTTLPDYELRDTPISLRARIGTLFLKCVLKPAMRWFVKGGKKRIAKGHLFLVKRRCKHTEGLSQHYRIINRVPGQSVGDFGDTFEARSKQRIILWLHGGGFMIPAAEETYVRFMALLCKQTNAVAFLPDYRLAPYNQFPHSLDDCERAYLGLLELGFAAENIWIGGDSAGGNLTLGTLQRIRKAGASMPAVATLLSPVTEMGRLHWPPSRSRVGKKDAILPIDLLGGLDDIYTRDWDASDPELSPMYADFSNMPPMHYIVGENEVLRDDTLLCAQRAKDAGLDTKLDVWAIMPHAFALFEPLYPKETSIVRSDMIEFAKKRLGPLIQASSIP